VPSGPPQQRPFIFMELMHVLLQW